MNIKELNTRYYCLDEKAKDKLKSGIDQYQSIQNMYREGIFDSDFQKTFRNFYRIYRRPQEFMDKCVEILVSKDIDIVSVTNKLWSVSENVELSFASKLIHTAENNFPIYDSVVAKNLKLRKPKPNLGKEDRIKDRINIHQELTEKEKEMLGRQEVKEILKDFSKEYDCENMSETKKLDFILWIIR